MSSIGPQLPPHLAKRKRSPDSDRDPDSPPSKTSRTNGAHDADNSDSDDDAYGPSIPGAATVPAPAPAPSIGPTMPPASTNTDEITLDNSDSDSDTGPAPAPMPAQSTTSNPPPKRVLGPAPPPASLSERPSADDDDSSSGSEDDYGPALPSATTTSNNPQSRFGPSIPSSSTAPKAPQRDDWMLAPPTASDGYRERDPTKIRSRKFASGASATTRPKDGSHKEISSIWTETPEEKVKRLADAVLGRGGSSDGAGPQTVHAKNTSGTANDKTKVDRDGRIKAFTEQTRGKSLYEEHQAARKAGRIDKNVGGARKGGAAGGDDDDEDDDPSKRAFDREKDMGLGSKISASQRKQLLNRAADFGGRFSKGNYL